VRAGPSGRIGRSRSTRSARVASRRHSLHYVNDIHAVKQALRKCAVGNALAEGHGGPPDEANCN
jgi:hypothetical protein